MDFFSFEGLNCHKNVSFHLNALHEMSNLYLCKQKGFFSTWQQRGASLNGGCLMCFAIATVLFFSKLIPKPQFPQSLYLLMRTALQ